MQITTSGAGTRIKAVSAALGSRGRPPSHRLCGHIQWRQRRVGVRGSVSVPTDSMEKEQIFNQAKGYAVPKCNLEWEI
jgi:hypothetical protein